MNFDKAPKGNTNPIEIKKDNYLDLINDFGMFITLNASKLDQQILPDKEKELADIWEALRKPIINGLNYSDFTTQYATKLSDATISKTLISQIYNFLQYIEPRLVIFKEDSAWVKRFESIKNKYINLVS